MNQRTSNTYHILSSPSTSSKAFSCHPPLLLHLRLDFLIQFPTFPPQLCILLHPNSRTNHLRNMSKCPLFLRAGWGFLAYCLFEQFNVCFVTARKVSALSFLDGGSNSGEDYEKGDIPSLKECNLQSHVLLRIRSSSSKILLSMASSSHPLNLHRHASQLFHMYLLPLLEIMSQGCYFRVFIHRERHVGESYTASEILSLRFPVLFGSSEFPLKGL
jgi:hypothetical protein